MQQVNKITSRDNARLSHLKRVRDGKVRDEIFLEGLRLVEEAVRSESSLNECFFTPRFAEASRAAELLERLSSRGARMNQVSDGILTSVSDTKNSQGIVLTATRPVALDFKNLGSKAAFLVYLHEVSDPSNLGAVFRTAEAAGAEGVILSAGSADAFSPKALRAAMGASLRLPVWEKADLGECVEWARENGILTVAADSQGTRAYTEIDWCKPSIVVFGSEAHGINAASLAMMDETIRIPMKKGVESLNLAVSVGIVLFEADRQRSLEG